MKILAAGDIHGDISLARNLAQKAKKEKVDLVILCGDLTYFDQSTKGIIGPFARNKQKVILIPGNHESFATADFLADLYGATNLHGYTINIGDVGLFGCGGANIGPQSALSEKEIFKILKKGKSKAKGKKTIMVTHVHPSGTKLDKISKAVVGKEIGSTGVEKAIKQFKPDFLLCSHSHESEGIEEKLGKTKVINVGRKGKIIKI